MCSPCDVLTIVWTTTLLCGIPPDLTNGGYSGPATAYPGSLYDYACDAGYIPVGDNAANLQVECLDTGKFNVTQEQLPICIRECSTPANSSTTSWSVSKFEYEGVYVNGTEVEYTCDASHVFYSDVSYTSICESDGNWSVEEVPECQPLCDVAPEITNGYMLIMENTTITDGNITATEVKYTCDPGFTFIPPGNVTLECHPGATWVPASPPTCQKECPPLLATDAMTLDLTNKVWNDTLVNGTEYSVTCDANHTISDYQLTTTTCDVDGMWDTLPTCEKDCGIADEVVNGMKTVESSVNITHEGGIRTLEHNVTYSCLPNHVMVPESSKIVECGTSGLFEPAYPQCLAECGAPPIMSNGTFELTVDIKDSLYIAGAEVTYTCNETYVLAPAEYNTLTCGSDGNWNGSLGACYKDCGTSPVLEYGNKAVMGIVVNSNQSLEMSVTYECPDLTNRTLVPNVTEWACLDDGNWSHSTPPKCLLECEMPASTKHGHYQVISSVYPDRWLTGTTVEYECEEFYVTSNDTIATCGDDGQWNMTTVPDCALEWSEYRHCSVDYSFFLTTDTGDYNEARAMCQAAGADLMHENFGFEPHGNKYFPNISALSTFSSQDNHYYLGVTDMENEGVWRFIDGTIYDWNKPDEQMFSWAPWEPNNLLTGEHCMEITDDNRLNDIMCTEDKNNGFCEFKNITCVYM